VAVLANIVNPVTPQSRECEARGILGLMPKIKSKHSGAPVRVAIAIMAAGKGTRLKSRHPKVLHEVGGKPLLAYAVAAAAKVVPVQDVYAIIGYEAGRVREALAHTGVRFVVQAEQRGTGHALMVASKALGAYDVVLVLSADAPLISTQTIQNLRDFHSSNHSAMTILTAQLPDPTGYGRVVRRSTSGPDVTAIVEEKCATSAEKKIREINAGFYAFDAKLLFEHIDRLSNDNPHGEFYLTDMAAIFVKAKKRVTAVTVRDSHEILGGNTRAELAEIDQHLRMAKCRQLMVEGVTIFYPQTCVIDIDVQIAADTVVEPFVQILGNTRIGSDCRIRSYSVIRDSEIGNGVLVRPGCVLDEARVKAGAVIGPYSHLRPGSEIGEDAHVGNFVETKKIRLGKHSKANHLTYLGDAEVGEDVNIGAGTITCNYDGAHKHTTVIEDGAFIGSDSTLVAPVKVGQRAYVAAGSCITDDVPAESLALGRARQIVKEGWTKERGAPRSKAESPNR
jgi:bifunctional UDP-N-acetylglucosamine pyrophosphorylase/glucosamine-1-phosphate N-acetyltransferase